MRMRTNSISAITVGENVRGRVMTRSHACEPGRMPKELAEQAANWDVGPIMRKKLAGDDEPTYLRQTQRSCGSSGSVFFFV